MKVLYLIVGTKYGVGFFVSFHCLFLGTSYLSVPIKEKNNKVLLPLSCNGNNSISTNILCYGSFLHLAHYVFAWVNRN